MSGRLAIMFGLMSCALHAGGEFAAPRVVGTPPADAGRGLVCVSATEIRHYDGDRKQPGYLVSRDIGETWKYEKAGPDYPPNYGGMAKESPAIVRNPNTGEFIVTTCSPSRVSCARLVSSMAAGASCCPRMATAPPCGSPMTEA
jgi:hypothetical protein